MNQRQSDLERIEAALKVAGEILSGFQSGNVAAVHKSNLDPVTEADLAVDRALRELLVQDGDAWLSEETADDPVAIGRPPRLGGRSARWHQGIRRGACPNGAFRSGWSRMADRWPVESSIRRRTSWRSGRKVRVAC